MKPEALNKMTVKALRDLARELAVTGYSRMKKAELVDAIVPSHLSISCTLKT